jgi:integrase
MTQPNLKLFRRHEATCTQNHAKDFRVYQWMLEKQKGKKATADCSCTVYAEGTLILNGSKNYVRPKSTGTRVWSEAEAVKKNWLAWGDTNPPADSEPEAKAGTLVTVQTAVNAFLSVKESQMKAGKILKDRYTEVEGFLTQRLIPFATIKKRLQYINEMDNESVWAEFHKGWKNLNPNNNRKTEGHTTEKPLGPGTLAKHISNLREFLKFCVRREWLSDNYASVDYGMTASATVKPKEPLSEDELSYIYRAAKEVVSGVGVNTKFAHQRAKELVTFIWTLRYTGLRICDVVPMEISQLQIFNHAGYTHAIWCNPQKTENSKDENFVHIPIPSDTLPNHPNLANALLELAPKQGRYFFKNGDGALKTAIGAWRRRVMATFDRAEELMKADGIPIQNGTRFGSASKTPEHPTPHKFRHTFAATLLQGGAPIRLVAQYLGDTEGTVRKHYAKFCRAEQEQAATRLMESMRQYDAQTAATRKARLRVVK